MKSATKAFFGLVIDIGGGADLLDLSLIHDDDGVAHGEGLLLIMGDIDKGDTHLLLDLLEFDLHVLAELEVQRAQRLVQKKDLRPVHDGPGDGHPLLLAAGEGIHRALAIAGQVDQGQGFLHPLRELRLRHLGDAQAKGHVLEDIHVGEERVFLKYGVDLPFVGRNIVDAFAVKEDLAGGGLPETRR